VGNLWKRDHLEGSLRRWEDIMMYLQEVEGEIMDWMELAQNRDRRRALVNVVIVLRLP